VPKTPSRSLHEVALNEPIRYNPGDPIEAWLTSLLCLDSHTAHRLGGGLPSPRDCDLYFVDRDALFSYHKVCVAGVPEQNTFHGGGGGWVCLAAACEQPDQRVVGPEHRGKGE
jgi:hypothetical protein